jgi:hypothetical protein
VISSLQHLQLKFCLHFSSPSNLLCIPPPTTLFDHANNKLRTSCIYDFSSSVISSVLRHTRSSQTPSISSSFRVRLIDFHKDDDINLNSSPLQGCGKVYWCVYNVENYKLCSKHTSEIIVFFTFLPPPASSAQVLYIDLLLFSYKHVAISVKKSMIIFILLNII